MYYNLKTEEISFLPIIQKNELIELLENYDNQDELSFILKSLSFLENNNEFCELYNSYYSIIFSNNIFFFFFYKSDLIKNLI